MRSRLAGAMAVVVTAAVVAFVPVGPSAEAAATTAATTPAAPGSVVPDEDPFYAAPANIASYEPGAVVDSRPVTLWSLGGPLVTRSWQVSYRSNDSHMNPKLDVTTLVVPTTPWHLGPRPVVSLQAAEDSTGTRCAPSYALLKGTDVQLPPMAAPMLAAGYALAIPDHEGPKSAFLAGPNAGHAVLDGIRAIKSFGQGGVGTKNKWALAGYSGGAHATGWAAQMQPTYAPDVKLVGAAMGGTPSNPEAVGRYIDGGFFAGFEFAAAYGISQEYPEAGIPDLLNAEGREAWKKMDGMCLADLIASFAFKKLEDHTDVPDPLSVPSVKAVISSITMGASAPTTPIFSYHANTDEVVPVGQHNTLDRAWCGKGTRIKIHR
ncbi:MAG: lipase family protein, partial [Nocardioides sp.]|uniref:lipase family protein n=1 Tax=Nocardioides sp. TaxID=35761 RepID=UPI003D6B299E